MSLGGCATAHSPGVSALSNTSTCATASARIAFDFDGASNSSCAILGEREFEILVTPEHAPPINPSPWYGFRYEAFGSQGIWVRLQYAGARHRYSPKLIRGTETRPLQAEVSADKSVARLSLPPGEGIVAATELFTSARNDQLISRLAALPQAERIDLGRSLDGRPVKAVRLGNPGAPGLVLLMGRQHPPEVTGALAMEAFVTEIANRAESGALAAGRIQFLIVPLLNPDGVARGHWRANRGATDLNRDWGQFSQPETRSVKAWLDALPKRTRPIAMIDFHSTNRNLFYVQSELEADEREERFLANWLESNQHLLQDYPFRIERRDANPALGTAKNWFHGTYDIPSYTYEVGDEADPEAIKRSAAHLAREFLEELVSLL